MTEVIGIGAALFDILITAEGFPREDAKAQGSDTRFQCGGPCVTTLVAMSKLGISAEYMGTLGGNMHRSFVRREFARFGMGCDNVRIVEGGQSFHSFAPINTEKSARTRIWNRGILLPSEMGDIDLETLSGAKYLHLNRYHSEVATYAAGKARMRGMKVSLNTGGIYPGIEKLLLLADTPTPPEELAPAVTGEGRAEKVAVALIERYHPETLVITQESRGELIQEKGQAIRYPTYPVKTIDTNGARDTFHGVSLANRVRGVTVYEAASFILTVSVLKCTRFSTQDGISGYKETVEFMKTNKGR